ncbi:hypothetical protein GQ53DRAFT_747818, partial [Thozetella sp. PMI_491]
MPSCLREEDHPHQDPSVHYSSNQLHAFVSLDKTNHKDQSIRPLRGFAPFLRVRPALVRAQHSLDL